MAARKEPPGRASPRAVPIGRARSARQSDGARLPPHNLEAEASLLGAMLLRSDAIAAAVSSVEAADFYKPAHGRIFEAIVAVYGRGEGTDAVTVAAELTRAGRLDDVGGPAALITLQAGCPAIGNAPAYARLVEEDSGHRRRIGIAEELSSAAYERHDPTAILGRLLDAGVGRSRRPALEVEDLAAVLTGDVADVVPTMWERTDGQPLVYPAARHALIGEPATGKTFLALGAAAGELAAGYAVLYLDYEGTRATVVSRLVALGVEPQAILGDFHYVRPGTLGPAERFELAELARDLTPTLGVVDGVAKGMARQGLNEDKSADFLTFDALVVEPMIAAGAAVILLDHVTKNPEQRGRWARGSGAKLAELDVGYMLRVDEPFSRSQAGRVRLTIAKDREGQVGAEGDVAAVARFTPGEGRLDIRLEASDRTSSGASSREPTKCMDAVVRVLDASPSPLTQSDLVDAMRAARHSYRTNTIREAAKLLAKEGRITETIGARNAHYYSITQPPLEAPDEDF